MIERERCKECGERLPRTYTLHLTSMHLEALKWFAESPIGRRFTRQLGPQAEKLRDSGYDKLAYWGLLSQSKDIHGFWCVTKSGKDFLNGYYSVPTKLGVRAGLVLWESPERIFAYQLAKEPFQYKGPKSNRLIPSSMEELAEWLGVVPTTEGTVMSVSI